MPDISYEDLVSGIFAPWFGDTPVADGERVAEPREAVVRAIRACLNAPANAKGVVRVVVDGPEIKRVCRNYIEAMCSEPRMKAAVKKIAPDGTVHFNGGLRLEVDANDQRLVSDAIATVIVDPTADALIGHVWWDADEETKEEAAARKGYGPDQVPRLRFIRWLAIGEGKTEVITPTADGRVEAGPPADAPDVVRAPRDGARAQDPEARDHDRLAQEQRYREAVERLERERINERLAEGYRKMGGVA
jgi:hypothetical protein